MHKAVVTALGHISERWRKELEQEAQFLGIEMGMFETLGHMNAEMPNAKI
jgi:hypothetical protein